jgi:hypothetical protein
MGQDSCSPSSKLLVQFDFYNPLFRLLGCVVLLAWPIKKKVRYTPEDGWTRSSASHSKEGAEYKLFFGPGYDWRPCEHAVCAEIVSHSLAKI